MVTLLKRWKAWKDYWRGIKNIYFMTSLLLFLIGVGVIQEIVKNLKPFEDVPVVSVETKDENKNQGSEVLKNQSMMMLK